MEMMARRRMDPRTRLKIVSPSPGPGAGRRLAAAPECGLRLIELDSRLDRLEQEKKRLLEARRRLEHPGKPPGKPSGTPAQGVVTLDPEGLILDANEAAAGLLGRRRPLLLRRRFALLLAPQDIPRLLGQLRRCVRGGQVVSLDLQLRRTDLGPVRVRLDCLPVLDQGARVSHLEVLLTDVTDVLGAAHACRETEARLQAILDNSPAMFFLKDIQGCYLHFNRQFERVHRLTLEAAVGRTDAELFGARRAAVIRANDLKVIEAGAPMVFEESSRHGDVPHTALVTRFPLLDHAGRIYAVAGIAMDVTERRRLETEVLEISEREQRRVAQDLHDGLGQQMNGILHLATALEARLAERSAPETGEAGRIVRLLGDSVGQLRALARGLLPVEDGGLAASLEQLARLVRDLFGIDCRFESPRPVSGPDPVVGNHLYRIAQEAIQNAIKHGRASGITVGLVEVSRRIVLTVRNNGAAIAEEPASNGGLGLRIMQHRAAVIGGSLVIVSDARRGTTVICMAPGGPARPKSPART